MRAQEPKLIATESGAISSPDAAPRAPTLEEFGLTTTLVERLPKAFFAYFFDETQQRQHNRVAVGSVVYAVIFVALFWYSNQSIKFGLIVALAFPFLGLMAAFIAIAGRAERAIWPLINPVWDRYRHFLDANALYATQLAAYRVRLAKRKEDYWRSLSGLDFEVELGGLFRRMGYNVEQTPYTGDGGVDLLLRKNGRLTVVQCKAHKKRIPIGVARQLYASMMDFKADDAIIASFEGVTKPVAEYIAARSISTLSLSEIIAIHIASEEK